MKKALKKKWEELSSKPLKLGAFLFALWLGFHILYGKLFLFHDGLAHIFPVVFGLAKQGSILGLPHWLATTDSGSPTLIYVMSMSLTTPLRILAINLMSILHMKFHAAMYFEKFLVLATFVFISLGMYVLGRILFRKHLSAIYLFLVTLFAGIGMHGLNSDQVFSQLFYMPWIASCAVLFHRNRNSKAGIWYLNATALFLSIALLDHNPHFPVFVALVGGFLYALCFPDTLRFLLKPKNLIRLWPLLIIGAVVAIQLWIVQESITNYVSALRLRGEIKIRITDFGDSNFIQPAGLLGTFWPMGFLRGLANFRLSALNMLETSFHVTGRDPFLYKYDQVVMAFGWIPLILFIGFLLQSNFKRQKLFWGGYTVLFLLISLQDSHLYKLFFRLPFFDLFRTYSLLIVQIVFGFLVTSAYGMEAYLTLNQIERKRMLSKSLKIAVALFAMSGLFLAVLMLFYKVPAPVMRRDITEDLFHDLFFMLLGSFVVWKAARSSKPAQSAAAMMVVFCISQLAFFNTSYRLLGNDRQFVQQYFMGLGDTADYNEYVAGPHIDRLPYKPGEKRPVVPHRILCNSYATCYVANQDAMSIWNPNFLIHRDEPFYRSLPDKWPPWIDVGSPYKIKLTQASYEAIAGVTHPVFWLSDRIIPFQDKDEITVTLNKQPEPRYFLDNAIFVPEDDAKKITASNMGAQKNQREITSYKRGTDSFQMTYKSEQPVYLAAAVNYDPAWRVTVGGKSLPVYRANYNGMVVQLPSGENAVEFKYKSWKSSFFFNFRYIFIAIGLWIMWIIAKRKLPKSL